MTKVNAAHLLDADEGGATAAAKKRTAASKTAQRKKVAAAKASKAAAGKAADRPRTAAGKAKVAVTRASRESAAARRRAQTDDERGESSFRRRHDPGPPSGRVQRTVDRRLLSHGWRRIGSPGILSRVAELLLDSQEPVVLRDPLRSAHRPGLDLSGVHRDHEIGDRRVLGLARPMADHRRPAGLLRHLDRLDRLGQRPDLIELHEDAVRRPLLNRPREPLRVRDQQVVADELEPAAEPLGQLRPSRSNRPRRGRPRG